MVVVGAAATAAAMAGDLTRGWGRSDARGTLPETATAEAIGDASFVFVVLSAMPNEASSPVVVPSPHVRRFVVAVVPAVVTSSRSALPPAATCAADEEWRWGVAGEAPSPSRESETVAADSRCLL